MNVVPSSPSENPFSSRFVRPGAVPFLFPPGESVAAIVARFAAADRRGAIVGPHGSGKSTLVEALLPQLRNEQGEVRVFGLHDGQRTLPSGFDAGLQSGDVLVIDGYEQLGWLGRAALRRVVRRRRCGLLVTAHRPVGGMSTLFHACPTPAATVVLVERLTAASPGGAVTAADVVRLFAERGGNVREVLFGLYDLYESNRS